MEHERFDRLSRRFGPVRNRRLTLAAALGGVLAAALGRDDAAAQCVKVGGTCKTATGHKKRCCGGAKCGGKRCRCVDPKENSGGVCARRPACRGDGDVCGIDTDCCGNNCGNGSFTCGLSTLGERCHREDDCLGTTVHCIGFVCRD